MTNIGSVASILATISAQDMTTTQKLLKFSLKCLPIHPGIHNDPCIGVRLRAAYHTQMAAIVNSWNSKLAILDKPATRKMVPITGRASSFFEFLIVCLYVNRKEEEEGETEQ